MQIPTEKSYAIFQTGGKQYQAIPGKTLAVDKIDGEPGAALSFDTVLFRKNDTDAFEFGAPYVDGATLKASIVKQMKAKKIIVFRHKRRKKYRVKRGHRQQMTVIRIESV